MGNCRARVLVVWKGVPEGRGGADAHCRGAAKARLRSHRTAQRVCKSHGFVRRALTASPCCVSVRVHVCGVRGGGRRRNALRARPHRLNTRSLCVGRAHAGAAGASGGGRAGRQLPCTRAGGVEGCAGGQGWRRCALSRCRQGAPTQSSHCAACVLTPCYAP